MGIDLVALLIDESSLANVLQTPWNIVFDGFENGSIRLQRVEKDAKLHRMFDIDIESEILDWMESKHVDVQKSILENLLVVDDGCDGLRLFMMWASPGFWEVWEGRAFIYLGVACNKEIEQVDDLYTEETWRTVEDMLTGVSKKEFSERVIMDWLKRREALGETIDETKDPKILPTFDAHTRAAETLIEMFEAKTEGHFGLVVGRDHLPSSEWGFGPMNLAIFLNSQP